MSLLIFDPASLQKALDETIPTALPEGHTSALVGTVDSNGVQAAIEVNKDVGTGTVTIQGVYRYTWTTQSSSVGAKVLYSW